MNDAPQPRHLEGNQLSQYELAFIDEQVLPEAYIHQARAHFLPLARHIIGQCQTNASPFFLGINGSQGSGKSTLSFYLKAVLEHHGLSVQALSLDDFYLGHQERIELSKTTHPLLKTRGVPGTHDIPLLRSCLSQIKQRLRSIECPRFDKATDDRFEKFDVMEKPCDVLIFEGWCWGASHQQLSDLETDKNDLEKDEDSDKQWRHYVNDALRNDYEPLYKEFDCWAMLKAPSFENVYKWRLEQEQKLANKLAQNAEEQATSKLMTPEQIQRFIAHYQRITEHTLITLPSSCDVLWQLDASRKIIQTNSDLSEYKNKPSPEKVD